MKYCVLLLFVFFTSMTIFGQSTTKPEFKFVKELINYGKVVQNSDGHRIFEFTNVGKSPLIITDIKTSCDCAVPEKPTAPIMPGEKGTITVSYDTSKIGGFSKQITIFSNAKTEIKTIRIKGFVVKKAY
ncbi:hypothetical protein KCTC32516_02328 [Polaribacter huanghezhanensis]|uniref:DUF1573 domain-containing protein n=1 Tax=Polaribacter huanghezhanensis TaxID=1354726 RepID=UPI002647EDC2|nr:DUF1573 domain-containing protein [Polaribacter huanghezhanensis]WKD86948.1 hypothetical protein KCTC32516_02328 [Polaribacter huanghezhanensis]